MGSTPELALLEHWVSALVLTMPRLLAVFMVVPFFSGSMISGLVRNGILLTIALFLAPMVVDTAPVLTLSSWMLVAKEALIGILLGLGFGMFIWAIQSVGDLVDFMTGSSNASFFDPVAGHETGPTGRFLSWLAIALFVASGGLLAMIGVIMESYRLWPVDAFLPDMGNVLEEFAVRQGDTLFQWIVKLVAPVMVVLFLVDLGLGLVGRAAPQLNVFVFAQPLKSLLAVLVMVLWLYFVYESLRGFLLPGNGVLDFLSAALKAE